MILTNYETSSFIRGVTEVLLCKSYFEALIYLAFLNIPVFQKPHCYVYKYWLYNLCRDWRDGRKRHYPFDDEPSRHEYSQRESEENYGNERSSWYDEIADKGAAVIQRSIDYHHGLSIDRPQQQQQQQVNVNAYVLLVVIIVVTTTLFMVLPSWHCYCESSPGSPDECSTVVGSCQFVTKVPQIFLN